MKNITIFIILGLFLISMTTIKDNFFTVKPANPVSTVCFTGTPVQLKNNIITYAKLGYIVKTGLPTSQGSTGRYADGLIVMEKY